LLDARMNMRRIQVITAGLTPVIRQLPMATRISEHTVIRIVLVDLTTGPAITARLIMDTADRIMGAAR
jgi:hypothetical protein